MVANLILKSISCFRKFWTFNFSSLPSLNWWVGGWLVGCVCNGEGAWEGGG